MVVRLKRLPYTLTHKLSQTDFHSIPPLHFSDDLLCSVG